MTNSLLPLPAGCALDHFYNSPRFVLRNRLALGDRHAIARLALIVRIVSKHFGRTADELAVNRMLDQAFDSDRDGFVHLVTDDTTNNRALYFVSTTILAFYTISSKLVINSNLELNLVVRGEPITLWNQCVGV